MRAWSAKVDLLNDCWLLEPLDVEGSLHRFEALENDDCRRVSQLTIRSTNVVAKLTDAQVVALYSWLGYVQSYTLWQTSTLLAESGFRPGGPLTDLTSAEARRAVALERWQRAGRAVMRTVASPWYWLSAQRSRGQQLSLVALHAKEKREYQRLYLQLCLSPHSTFHSRSAKMDCATARRALSRTDERFLQRIEDEVPHGTIARWRLSVIVARKLDVSRRSALRTNFDEVDDLANQFLTGVTSEDAAEAEAESDGGGQRTSQAGLKRPKLGQLPAETNVQIEVSHVLASISALNASMARSAFVLSVDSLCVRTASVHRSEESTAVSVGSLCISCPLLADLGLTDHTIVRLAGREVAQPSRAVNDTAEAERDLQSRCLVSQVSRWPQGGGESSGSLCIGRLELTHVAEFCGFLEELFVPVVEEMDRWPLISTARFRLMMRRGKLTEVVDDVLGLPWFTFDVALMAIFKSSGIAVCLGPPRFTATIGPTHLRLLEPMADRRVPGQPPEPVLSVTVPEVTLVRARDESTGFFESRVSLRESVSILALQELTERRQYDKMMASARLWKCEQGHRPRLQAVVAARSQRRRIILQGTDGAEGQAYQKRREQVELVDAVYQAVGEAVLSERAAQRHRRPSSGAPWYMTLGMVMLGIVIGLALAPALEPPQTIIPPWISNRIAVSSSHQPRQRQRRGRMEAPAPGG